MEANLLLEQPLVRAYLERLRRLVQHLPPAEADELRARALAEIELEACLRYAEASDTEAIAAVLARLGPPEALVARLGASCTESAGGRTSYKSGMCHTCGKVASREWVTCPHCGSPQPARRRLAGKGYEWKSNATSGGWPLIHITWGSDENGPIRVARRVIAIGQFGIGLLVGVRQISVGVFAAGMKAFARWTRSAI